MPRKPDLPGADAFFTAANKTDTEANAPSRKTSKKQREGRGARKQASSQTPPRPDEPDRRSATRTSDTQGSRQFTTIDPAFIDGPTAPPLAIPQPPTEKVTIYLPAPMLEQLEICRVRLLTEHGIKAGRSQITQAALALTLPKVEILAEGLTELARIWAEYGD